MQAETWQQYQPEQQSLPHPEGHRPDHPRRNHLDRPIGMVRPASDGSNPCRLSLAMMLCGTHPRETCRQISPASLQACPTTQDRLLWSAVDRIEAGSAHPLEQTTVPQACFVPDGHALFVEQEVRWVLLLRHRNRPTNFADHLRPVHHRNCPTSCSFRCHLQLTVWRNKCSSGWQCLNLSQSLFFVVRIDSRMRYFTRNRSTTCSSNWLIVRPSSVTNVPMFSHARTRRVSSALLVPCTAASRRALSFSDNAPLSAKMPVNCMVNRC